MRWKMLTFMPLMIGIFLLVSFQHPALAKKRTIQFEVQGCD